MSYVLGHLEPSKLFTYFEELTRIPRGSGNEKEVSDYLVKFAKDRNLEVYQDNALNVLIKKPGTQGYENSPAVIIQGHMDMVNEKNKDTVHDFDKDPLKLRVVDDYIYASGTTLGADNGIAVAMGMALLDSNDIPHPPIEVLVTSEEETGMGGAMNLDTSHIDGSLLINIDSEEEGTLLVSCAGGVRVRHVLPLEWTSNENSASYEIQIRGLKGGHSGMEIIKGRGNSNKIMGRLLFELSKTLNFNLAEVSGGSKMNAIPREADALISITNTELSTLEKFIKEFEATLKAELRAVDPDISISLVKVEKNLESVLTPDCLQKVISSLVLMPNGIQTMSADIEGLVESSTNVGVVTFTKETLTCESAVRSSVKSLKYYILNQMKTLASTVGGNLEYDSDYPEWEYNPTSTLRDTFKAVYQKLYNKEVHISAIHAGLECGLLKEKLPNLDMISLGPNLYDVHTPDEHLSISSTQRIWEYLKEVLKELK